MQTAGDANQPHSSGASVFNDFPPEHRVAADEQALKKTSQQVMPMGDVTLTGAGANRAMVGAADVEVAEMAARSPPRFLVKHPDVHGDVHAEMVSQKVFNAVHDGANAAAAAVNSIADQIRAAGGNIACMPAQVLQGVGILDWKAPRPLNWVLPLESDLWPLGCDVQPERCRFFREA